MLFNKIFFISKAQEQFLLTQIMSVKQGPTFNQRNFMKQKLITIVSSLLMLAGLSANAADSSMQNTLTGNYQVGGNASWVKKSNTPSLFTVNPLAEYFLVNGISLGGTLNYTSDSNNNNTFGVGPSATWYMWQQERHAVYGGVGIMYDTTSSGGPNSNTTNFWASDLRIGYNYFFTPSLALGPVYMWHHQYNNDSSSVTSSDTQTAAVQFSMYL